MKFTEKLGNLFNENPDAFMQCVSADFAMGAGIAPQFNQRFHVRELCKKHFPNYLAEYDALRKNPEENGHGDIIVTGKVINLITKRNCWQKPTYQALEDTLKEAREYCEEQGIKTLAMPKIACGLDGLEWDRVRNMLQDVFRDADMELIVCELQRTKTFTRGADMTK